MGINEIIQIGSQIKKMRISKGLTQKKMAELTGIPYSTYSNYENNNREPNGEQLQKISTILGITIDELLYFAVDEERAELTPDEFSEQIAEERGELTKEEWEKKDSKLTRRDEKDIAKLLESTLENLEDSQSALMFSGEPLDDETRELLKASLENSIRIAKINAKQKYTPKKYRKIPPKQ